jgi:hypothetical protein
MLDLLLDLVFQVAQAVAVVVEQTKPFGQLPLELLTKVMQVDKIQPLQTMAPVAVAVLVQLERMVLLPNLVMVVLE